MKQILGIIAGILSIISGVLALGIGYTIKCPHPCNTIIFLSGFLFIILGLIILIKCSKK